MVSQVEAGYRTAAKQGPRQISIPIVMGLAKAVDLFIVGAPAIIVFCLYVNPNRTADSNFYFVSIMLALLVSAVVFRRFQLYDERRFLSSEGKLTKTWSAWGVCIGLFLLIAFSLKISDQFSRVWFTVWITSAGIGLALHHISLRYLVGRWAKEGLLAARTVILGAGTHGARLAAFLQQNEDFKTRIVGFIDDRADRVPRVVHGLPVMGTSADLERMVRQDEVDEVIVALPWSAEERLRQIAHRLATLPVQIRLAPDLAGFSFRQRQFSFVAGLPMLGVFERPISGWSSVAKATEDRLLGGILLLVMSPVFLILAALIKLDSPGPVFFRQQRHGFNNQLIDITKFRTMYADKTDPTARTLACKNDPRVTRMGRFLRATSLDELPQLINVVKGDMSLVGPRPHAQHASVKGQLYWDMMDDYAARHNVKPGITGWAQVNGWRGETDTEEKIKKRVEHDLFYIENWSVWLDVKILVRTLFVVLKGENAY